MLDAERDQLRKSYEVCRVAFGLLSAALMIACFDALIPLLATFHPDLAILVRSSSLYHWLDVPITFGCLFGVMLLWGRFDHPGWRRRVGLLMVMSLVDVALWYAEHGSELGLIPGRFAHQWICGNIGQALGWAEFALMAGLGCDYLEHLGIEYARESGKSIRSMAATGAFLWLLFFCQHTNWWAGWPLIPHARPRSIEVVLLYYAQTLIWAITLIQVTAMLLSATRMSGQVLAEMKAEDDQNDPLRPQSEWSKDFDLFGA